jgi:hypothetical protein
VIGIDPQTDIPLIKAASLINLSAVTLATAKNTFRLRQTYQPPAVCQAKCGGRMMAFYAREFRTENKLVNGFVQRQILSGAASHCGETSSIVAGLRYIVHAFTCYPQVPVISREGTVLMRIGARIMAMKEAAKF